jgi:hypothetical protein
MLRSTPAKVAVQRRLLKLCVRKNLSVRAREKNTPVKTARRCMAPGYYKQRAPIGALGPVHAAQLLCWPGSLLRPPLFTILVKRQDDNGYHLVALLASSSPSLLLLSLLLSCPLHPPLPLAFFCGGSEVRLVPRPCLSTDFALSPIFLTPAHLAR